MSFILDALRKSEHERQRQSGPALAEVPVAAPRPRSNVWAPIAIALLLVNLVVVGVWLIRKSMSESAVTPPPAAAVVDETPAATRVAPSMSNASPSPTGNPTAAVATPPPPPMLRPAEPATAPLRNGRNPLEAETASGPPALDPQMAAQAAEVPDGPAAVRRAPTSRGSVVYESLPDSATVGSEQYTPPASTSRQPASTGPGLPSADQLAATGIPALNLDLHVYATVPAERLVFINSRKYREGETLQEGPVVSQITPSGVVLGYQGRSYLLTHN